MRRLFVPLLLLVAVSLAAQEEKAAPDSRVTIGLAEYESLRRGSEAPAATVIDTILISGSFREKNLAVTFSGRTTKSRPQVRALDQTNDVTISGCEGNGIIARAGKGSFDLIPLADSFDLRCELRISGSDRLRMHVPTTVLAVRSSVADGELVTGDEDEGGARDYTLVRHVAGPGETLAATATGRYRITLLPDATRFNYAIDVHNPNRTTSTLELALQSNEHLQQIDSAAPYEVANGRYTFSIPPGDSTITMTGELRGTSFVAPVRASLQYLVLESHPLLRPTVQTPAKRISLGETGVTPQYRGAVAFETGTERIEWKVTRLEAMHAISYALNSAEHTLFVPIDGPVLGESTFALRNEGAAELVLPAKPEPTYVSLAGEPVLMTKNAAGQLTVPLSQGEQAVLVQHRQPLQRVAGFAIGQLTIPQLDVPATNTYVRLTYPGQWIPLYESFASGARIWVPNGAQVALFLLLAVWIERLLAWLNVSLQRRLVAALCAALAASIVTVFLVLVAVVFGALTVLWFVASLVWKQRLIAVAGASAALVLLMIVYVGAPRSKMAYESQSPMSSKVDSAVTDTMATDTAGIDQFVRTRQGAGSVYQGLPARFTLPAGERSSFFSQELLRTDRPQSARVLAISLTLANWLGLLVGLVAIALLWADRRAVTMNVRERIDAIRPAAAVAAE